MIASARLASRLFLAFGVAGAFSVVGAAGAEPPERAPVRVSLPNSEGPVTLPRSWRPSGSTPPSARPGGEGPGANASRGGKAAADGDGKGFEWTEIEPSPDTRFVYVSSSSGSDANSGFAPDLAVQTLAKGKSLMRDGYPDQMLLRKGDAWKEDFGKWKLSGRSEAEPMVIGAYGDPKDGRPLVQTGTATRGLWLDGASAVSHVAVMGIEFFAHTYDGGEGAQAGLLYLGGGTDILVEDCLFRGYKDNIVLNGFNDTLRDVTVRGCVVVDAYSTIAHAQGLYAHNVDGLLIEGCVFDHNGWNESVAGAEPTIFNHNVYIQTTARNVTVRNNLIMNGASHGVQLRPGGVCEDNVILFNAIGVLAGNEGDADPVEVSIAGNAIMYGDDIAPDKPRGMGIDLQNVDGGSVVGNLLAHNESTKPYGHAIKLHSTNAAPVRDLRIADNTIYDWQGGLRFKADGLKGVVVAGNRVQNEDASVPIVRHEGPLDAAGMEYKDNVYHSNAVPVAWFQVVNDTYNFGAWQDMAGDAGSSAADLEFAEPWRSIETYQSYVGGESGAEGFVEAVRSQSKDSWDEDYSVPAILGYFRAGFGVDAGLEKAVGLVGQ